MPFGEAWRDQYNRMLRSHRNLHAAAGPSNMGSDYARDTLYHFFTDAYHLKDWLINDLAMGKQARAALEKHVTSTAALARCADIANGVKHHTLNHPRVPGKPAELKHQSVTIHLGSSDVMTTGEHYWHFTFDGQKYDVLDLVDEVVAEWEAWLKAEGLL